MINSYSYNNDENLGAIGLSVTMTESNTLKDVQRIVALGKPAKVLDGFIERYLITLDPAQKAADAWYEQQLLLETLDPQEQPFTRTYIDNNGDEQTEILPNPYEVALTQRMELENSNTWLKGLRGLAAPERPAFVVDVEGWKATNIDVRQARQQRYIAELSEEGTFEKTVGDCLDAIIDALTGDPSKLVILKDKIDTIKTELPKKG